MELTVIVPTRDRRMILAETLTRLEAQTDGVRFEVIVIDDGSSDGTAEMVAERAGGDRLALTLVEHSHQGPAVARNRALDAARAPVCLFLNDDSWPHEDLLARHRDFHARHPEPEAALLGRIALPSDPPPTPFMRWLAELHFDYGTIDDHRDVGGKRFFTANVSAKTELLRSVGGFDEGFVAAAHEDIDLGLRLQERGMRLAYDPEALVEHQHPMDLPAALGLMEQGGRTLVPFVERHPGWPVTRRPGARHRLKAAALTALTAAGVRTPRLQREVWRFLCHEAHREAYWDAVESGEQNARSSSTGPRIGGTLARLASRSEETRMPHGKGTP